MNYKRNYSTDTTTAVVVIPDGATRIYKLFILLVRRSGISSHCYNVLNINTLICYNQYFNYDLAEFHLLLCSC